jgi:hypothetical protein
MDFDLVPAELLAGALTAVMLSIPIAFALAAGVLSGPRRTWSGAGLAMGIGLLVGVLLAAAGAFTWPPGVLATVTGIGMLAGLVCAAVAGVLVLVLEDGTALSTTVGVLACVLIGLGAPGEAMPALFGFSASLLVVLAAVVIGAVALVAIVGFLVAVAGRVRALQIGVASAGIVAAVLTGIGMLLQLLHEAVELHVPQLPLLATLVMVLVALVIGSVVGGVLDTMRARRRTATASGPS